MIFALLFGLLISSGPASPAAVADSGLLPPDGFLKAWARSENPRAFTAADLYGHIDGGAELFFEFGFEQLTVQRYKRASTGAAASKTEEGFEIELYRMTDTVAAAGIYLMNCGQETPDASFRERHTVNRHQLRFRRDRYYVVLNNLEGGEQLRTVLLDAGRFVASKLPADKPLAIESALPPEGMVKGSLRLLRGPVGMQVIYSLGEGDILQLRRSLTAASADYQDAAGKRMLIRVEYPDERSAADAWAHLQGHLDGYLKVLEKKDRGMVFQDFSKEFGVIRLAGRLLTITVHLAARPIL